jgi:hypothetical protein
MASMAEDADGGEEGNGVEIRAPVAPNGCAAAAACLTESLASDCEPLLEVSPAEVLCVRRSGEWERENGKR